MLSAKRGGASCLTPKRSSIGSAERTELQEQLEKLERGGVENATLPFIRYLKTRIEELGRYIAKLEKR